MENKLLEKLNLLKEKISQDSLTHQKKYTLLNTLNNILHNGNTFDAILNYFNLGSEKDRANLILECLKMINASIDYNEIDISNAIYFYEASKEHISIIETKEYKSSLEILQKIKDKLEYFIMNNNLTEDINNDLELNKNIETLIKLITTNSLDVEIDDIHQFDSVLNYNENDITEEDKLEIYKRLISIKKETFIKKEAALKQSIEEEKNRELDERAKDVSKKIETELFDTKEEKVDSNKYSDNILDEETNTRLNNILMYFENNKYLISNLSDERKRSYVNTYKSYKTSKLDIRSLLESFSEKDYRELILYNIKLLIDEIQEYKETLNEEKYLSMTTDLIKINLDSIEENIQLLNELDKEKDIEVEEITDLSDGYKLVFYGYDDKTTEIEKDIKNMSPEKISDLINLLNRLKDTGGVQSKIVDSGKNKKMLSILGTYSYVLFRVLPKKHILVYCSNDKQIPISGKSLKSKITGYSEDISSIKETIMNDESVEYRKLMSRNNEIFNRILSLNNSHQLNKNGENNE